MQSQYIKNNYHNYRQTKTSITTEISKSWKRTNTRSSINGKWIGQLAISHQSTIKFDRFIRSNFKMPNSICKLLRGWISGVRFFKIFIRTSISWWGNWKEWTKSIRRKRAGWLQLDMKQTKNLWILVSDLLKLNY